MTVRLFPWQSMKTGNSAYLTEKSFDVWGCVLSTEEPAFVICRKFRNKNDLLRKFFIRCKQMSSKLRPCHSKNGFLGSYLLLDFHLCLVQTQRVTTHQLEKFKVRVHFPVYRRKHFVVVSPILSVSISDFSALPSCSFQQFEILENWLNGRDV